MVSSRDWTLTSDPDFRTGETATAAVETIVTYVR
jgi:hypothetical protein